MAFSPLLFSMLSVRCFDCYLLYKKTDLNDSTLTPRAEWSFRLVVSSSLRVPDGEMSVMLISPLCRCCNVTFNCTCSTFRISEAVLEHAEVFADRMRLPDAGIYLLDKNQRL